MKIRHIEYVRLAILSSYIAATALTTSHIPLLQELNEQLSSNNISIEDIRHYLSAANTLSLLVGFKLEQVTKDYERIESIYNSILYNTAELIEGLGIQDDPIKVFALFVYLYRSGYLSYNKQFKYSTKMKDLPLLGGVDVVRGYGVCRSISSMFTDLCNVLDITASNVAVKATSKALDKKDKLSPVDLQVEPRGKKFAKIVGAITTYLPVGNHLVTRIHTDKVTGIFDPTNDIFMHTASGRTYTFANDTSAKMTYSYASNIVSALLDTTMVEPLPIGLQKDSKKPQISYEEYQSSYKEVLELIKASEPIFEEFYKVNEPYYAAIEKLTKNQHGMITRMFPIIPEIKRKNK